MLLHLDAFFRVALCFLCVLWGGFLSAKMLHENEFIARLTPRRQHWPVQVLDADEVSNVSNPRNAPCNFDGAIRHECL